MMMKYISLKNDELCYCGFIERGKLSVGEKLLKALDLTYYIPIQDDSRSFLAKRLFDNENAPMPFVRIVFVVATPQKMRQLLAKQFPINFSCDASGEAIATLNENMFHSFYHFLHTPLRKTEHEIIIEQGESGEDFLNELSTAVICGGGLKGCEGLYWEGENYQGRWMHGIGFPLTPNFLFIISCKSGDLRKVNEAAINSIS